MSDLSTLAIVRVGPSMSYSLLKVIGDTMVDSFKGAIADYKLMHHQAPHYAAINAGLLCSVLREQYPGHVLGVTDADLYSADDGCIFAGKLDKANVAIVSSRRLMVQDISSPESFSLYVSRIIKESLHEVGHNFGLVHHYRLDKGQDKKLCPMSKGDFNKFGEKAYIEAIIDGRGYRFCDFCYDVIAARVLHDSP